MEPTWTLQQLQNGNDMFDDVGDTFEKFAFAKCMEVPMILWNREHMTVGLLLVYDMYLNWSFSGQQTQPHIMCRDCNSITR